MKHSDFVHLHTHTQYSLLDGACLIDNLLKRVKEMKMPAISITDHGNMFGAIEFYQKAMEQGIKPIIGCEVYLAPNSRFEKASQGIQEASFHLTLLAKNEEGYSNLMRLVSAGYLEGFYYRPRVDKELLETHHKGIIALSGCLKGELSHLIRSNELEQASRTASWYHDIFGKGNYYLEIQDNKIQEQNKVNTELINISKSLNIPLVATNDIHYLMDTHARAHEVLLCIQTQTTLDDPHRMRLQTDEFYLKSPEQMKAAFAHVPQAISNTIEIAEKCNLELDFKKTHLPQFHAPEGKTREEFLLELCDEGLKSRYKDMTPEISDRIKHELNIIQKSGYVSYFLIVWDFVQYAKNKGIPVGPGRGSAAGSVVSYCLGITDVDPLKYDLLFERFLNPERVSLPDIDIDFCFERRQEVIDYVVQKYGAERVAQIITFGTMLAKAAVRDVARAMGMPYADADKIAKMIPNELNITLKDALEAEPELKKLYDTDPRITQLIDNSIILEGLTRHASIHAAGVVIGERPLAELVPMFRSSDGQVTTGYPMTTLEKIGLLKMDFLGLRTLTVVSEAVKIIKRVKNIDIAIETIPLDDPVTFGLLCNAEAIGIFQLESSGMRDLLKKLKPTKFEDIIALLALFRPGPIGSGMLDEFIKRKHGLMEIKYDHPKLELILKETYGIILYQEQVMRIATELAGFSMAQADSLRRAIGKKNPEVMAQARMSFIEGALKRGVDRKTTEKIFGQIEYFGGYGFNKSHSTAYAIISFRTAYLKANYPVEFMTALLTSERDNLDKISMYIDEAERMNIKVLPPAVNESYSVFTVVPASDGVKIGDPLALPGALSIRFGLAAIKNVGRTAIDSIIEVRKTHGSFKSLYDFTEHVDIRVCNRKIIESLIKCGAFDSFGLRRSQLAAIVDKALDVANSLQKDRQNGQFSFFETFEDQDDFKKTVQEIPDIPEWPETQLLSYEKEMLGFYITKHPLARYEQMVRDFSTSSVQGLAKRKDGDEIFIGGIIHKLKLTTTKKTNERMAILVLEDMDSSVEGLVFPSVFQKFAQYIRPDALVFIRAKLNMREEQPKLIVNEVMSFAETQAKYTKSLSIRVRTAGLEEATLEKLKDILLLYQGTVPASLSFITPEGKRIDMPLGERFGIQPNEELVAKIEELLGSGVVIFNAKKVIETSFSSFSPARPAYSRFKVSY